MAGATQDPAWIADDPYLQAYRPAIRRRQHHVTAMQRRLTENRMSLEDFAGGHEYFGLHRRDGAWIVREWAPSATCIMLTGDFADWKAERAVRFERLNARGIWEARLPEDLLKHGMQYHLHVEWPGGSGERIPAYARRVVQDPGTQSYNAQVWDPPQPYQWEHPDYRVPERAPLVYECHVGMAQEREGVGTFDEFTDGILPRVAEAGYNTLQLMAILEHPYYASFGYQVSSFFAVSSRFGTPEAFKRLVDRAHAMDIAVVIDLVHSHAAANETEGLARLDGTDCQYFHAGARGQHPAWGSRCFDYGKPEVAHFLLSNCRYWLDTYRVDGFRFDGVTSMLYTHHGLGTVFDSYDHYFGDEVDEDAFAYLALANRLIHTVRPDAITVAEDVSGMPGLAVSTEHGGAGFDYRLAMGIPDCWFKCATDVPDESWDLDTIWFELGNRRAEEKTISYVECHDQALVGGKSLIFELADASMYTAMHKNEPDLRVDRAVALHKMIRLATLATAGHGYLTFMGNEFGHPEWIDFPREGNDWSYKHAQRLWRLRNDPSLKYHGLAEFDRAMLDLCHTEHLLEYGPATNLLRRNDDKTLAFRRGTLLFLFNFHPNTSYTDYEIEAAPGSYRLLLDTDEVRFSGSGRLASEQQFVTAPRTDKNVLRHLIRVYLPCRTALVLRACSRSADMAS